MNISMTQELYDQISGLTPKPPPATDRLEERYKDEDTNDEWEMIWPFHVSRP